VGHALRSRGLLRLEASQARFSQFASKLPEARRWVVHVTSSRRSREDKAEDGQVDAMSCIRFLYPYFAIFVVLGPSGCYTTKCYTLEYDSTECASEGNLAG
jgi:hypothetical protein